MKFKYTKTTQNQEGKEFTRSAWIDTDRVWHCELVQDVLVCHIDLEPIQVNRPRVRYNNKGQPNGVQYMKETEHPVIEITVSEEIDLFLELWTA